MMSFAITAAVLVAGSAGLVLLARKNLEHRELARRLRDIFLSEANDLVSKAEFPDAHARQLVDMAALPEGWVTRFFVVRLAKRMFFGRNSRRRSDTPRMEQVPPALRRKYVLAMLAFALSDSYRCVIFGHIFRAANGWLDAAVREPKRDVDAHATQEVIEQVSQVRAPKWQRERELLSA